MNSLFRNLLTVIFLILASGSANAAAVKYIADLDTVIEEGASMTYADLLKQIFKQVRHDGTDYIVSALAVTVRMAEGDDRTAPEDAKVADVAITPVKIDGVSHAALLVKLDAEGYEAEGYAILALFTTGREWRLVDALQVASGNETAFMENPTVPISAKTDAVATMSEHLNSSQAYDSYYLFGLVGGKIVEIDNVFAISDTTCAYERRDKVEFKTKSRKPYNDVIAQLTETVKKHDDEGCGEEKPLREGTQVYRRTSRWNNKLGKYVTTPSELDKLEKSMDDRM